MIIGNLIFPQKDVISLGTERPKGLRMWFNTNANTAVSGAVTKNGMFYFQDRDGNLYRLYPQTSMAAVEGLNSTVSGLNSALNGKLSTATAQSTYATKTYAKTTEESVSLPASGWEGSGPFTQTVTVSSLTTERRAVVHPAYGNDAEGNLAMLEACECVSFAKRSGSSITFTCMRYRPETDINVIVEVYI